MKKIASLIVMLVLLAGCQAAPTATPFPTVIPPTLAPTLLPPSPTVLPSPTPLSTPPPTKPPTPIPAPSSTPTVAAELKGRYSVVKPSAQDEVNRIWSTLKNMEFYDQYGYAPVFPSDPAVKAMLQKARDKKLENQDLQTLSTLMTTQIFIPGDYEKSYQKVIASLPMVEQVLPTFQKFKAKWGFNLYPAYTVRLTMYGVGGSYDPQKGDIILQTNKEGTFGRGPDPTETIIHESVHLGIEANIIQTNSIEQRVKERIVDKFVSENFTTLVPGYKLQSLGDTSVDKYLQGEGAWDNLPDRIKEYKSNK
jgi:hypothetical protein